MKTMRFIAAGMAMAIVLSLSACSGTGSSPMPDLSPGGTTSMPTQASSPSTEPAASPTGTPTTPAGTEGPSTSPGIPSSATTPTTPPTQPVDPTPTTPSPSPTQTPRIQVSRLVDTPDGHTYLMANDQPLLLYGVQLRLDDYLAGTLNQDKLDGLENYFRKSKELGFRLVVVSIPWNRVEFLPGEFDFDLLLGTAIGYAEKYDLLIDVNWFGALFAGWPNMAPPDILQDRVEYPRLDGELADPFDLRDLSVGQREASAMKALMKYLAVRDRTHRVVCMTVGQEPDMKPVTGVLWGGQRDAILQNLLRPVGMAVQESDIGIVTRAYVTIDVFNLKALHETEGIDLVGNDPYKHNPYDLKQIIARTVFPGNIPHAAENGAQYASYFRLVFAALDEASGYLAYELRTTGAWRNYDFGFFRKTTPEEDRWIERDGTQEVAYYWDGVEPGPENRTSDIRAFNFALQKFDRVLAGVHKDRIAVFNLRNLESRTETLPLGNSRLTVSTTGAGCALAFLDPHGSHIILMGAEAPVEFQLKAGTSHGAEEGAYDKNGNWQAERQIPISNGGLTLSPYQVVRVPVSVVPTTP